MRPSTAGYDRRVAIDVSTEIEIARPRGEVAAYAADPDYVTAWYANIESVEWQTPRPAVVGSRLAFVARFLGRRLAYTYEVREVVADERFVMSTERRPVPDADDLRVGRRRPRRDTDDAAKPRRARGLPRLFAPLMATAVRRANRKDLARLKELLEGGAPATPRSPNP